jgi:hypothetical protein
MARTSKPNAMQTMTGATPGPRTLTPEERRQMIAQAAYHRAEKRGFTSSDPPWRIGWRPRPRSTTVDRPGAAISSPA